MIDKVRQSGQSALRHVSETPVRTASRTGAFGSMLREKSAAVQGYATVQGNSLTAQSSAGQITTQSVVNGGVNVSAQSVVNGGVNVSAQSGITDVSAQSIVNGGVNVSGQSGGGINFSKHALARAEQRGIELTPALMNQLAGSVEKAQEKGAKNILAFDSTRAFIINIPYGRVITAMSQEDMRENIFTNIDGAVLLS